MSKYRNVSKQEFEQFLDQPGVQLGGWFNEDCFAYNEYAEIVGHMQSPHYDVTEWLYRIAFEPIRTSSSKERPA